MHAIITQCCECTAILNGSFEGTKLGYLLKDASHGMCEACRGSWWKKNQVIRIQSLVKKQPELLTIFPVNGSLA